MIRGQDYSGGEVRVDDLYYVSPRLAASFDRASVRGGDILLSIVGYVGLVAEVPEILSGANLTQTTARIAIQEELHSRFFLHFFRSKAFHSEVKKYMKGSAQPGLNLADVEKMKVIFPERREEQAAISKILDTLDTAIQETEAIIAKLKAVKQGLLHDLLTRGIDANGELRPPQSEAPNLYKPSPLGWIPKEWDIATLEAVSSTVTSGSRDWARFYAESGALFVRIGNLTREHINFRFDSTIYVCPPHNADGQRTRLEPGDILISITADLGIVGVVPDGMGEAYINQHIALVRPNIGAVNPRFVGHYLASPVAQAYISKLNDAGAKAGLNLPTIRGLLTARPEHTEQNLIAERLDEIDNRIQNATRESAKLRDLKFGLMDDLLIGRVRVTPLLQEAQQA
ncbi:type I restriction enzyme S subunit [Pseudofulvimonas gallinarii]|uniref:Type I restriction enzyme S subunit n=2 Tax=Pseudofulvimonas gallinarii TaxID=634155 RepID=A0A4R3LMX3_9GAMM|nr:type I restriction enzyme S subunit [Pseudofulvimonas gallinarii]